MRFIYAFKALSDWFRANNVEPDGIEIIIRYRAWDRLFDIERALMADCDFTNSQPMSLRGPLNVSPLKLADMTVRIERG